jgi:hypothetical protein
MKSTLLKVAVTSVAALGLPFAAMAQVTNVVGTPVVIDGTLPDTGFEFSDPFGNVKELGPVNSTSTKLGSINTAGLPMLQFTNPNGSTDLTRIWMATVTDSNEEVWLYFAWERESNSGSATIAFEFQNAPADPACDYSTIDQTEPASEAETTLINSCNPWANRATGDFMIVWDFGGSATDIVLRTYDSISGAFGVGENLSMNGTAGAQLNIDSSQGEGVVNLSQTIFASQTGCFNVANVIPGTITGNSDQADYKDTVLADINSAVTISNCGTVNITKSTEPAGELGTFTYTLDRKEPEGSPDDPIDFDGTTSATGELYDDGGNAQVVVLPGDNYQLTEDLTAEPDYSLKSISCNKPNPADASTFIVNVAETTDCVITNELKLGTITVTKTVDNRYGGKATSSQFCFSLNDDTTPTFTGSDQLDNNFTFVDGHNLQRV